MLVQPGSFRTRTPRPSYTQFQTESATKQQLIKESASLVPDSERITEQLMKFELSPADNEVVKNRVNGILSNYLSNYKQNPYYAFSKEAVNQTRELQGIVNNPDLARMQDFYKQSRKEYDKLDESRLLSTAAYSDGQLKVFDKKTGDTRAIDFDDYDPSRHAALDLQEDYSDRVSRKGFVDSERPFQYDMSDPTKIQEKLMRYFSGLGSTERENVTGQLRELSQSTKTNRDQIDKALQAVFSSSGLSTGDINTLMAQTVTPYLRSGKKINSSQAWRQITDYIGNLADSKSEYSENVKVNPEFTAANQGAQTKILLGKTSPIQEMLSGLGAQKTKVLIKDNDRATVTEATTVPPQAWFGSQKRIIGDNKSVRGEEVLSNLQSLQGGTLSTGFLTSDARVINSNNNRFENVDIESVAPNLVLDRRKSFVVTVPFIMKNGEKEYMFNTTLAEQEARGNTVGYDTFLKTKAKILDEGINREGALDTFGKNLRQKGYSPDFSDSDSFYKNNVSTDATDLSDWLNKDYYEFDLFIPTVAADPGQFPVFGEGYVDKNINTFGAQEQGSYNPSSKAENASQYSTFDNLFVKKP